MANKCRECKTGTLKIIGTGYYGDTIEVECQNEDCGEMYEVEPDGLGMGGMEFVEAQMLAEEKQMEKEDEEEEQRRDEKNGVYPDKWDIAN